ncbi:DUF2207 domain-containing protein [Rathayibacter caricis]|uniref:DUF2207 family protein n=1 Tax=Rathayibacter caricis TaxID=110936 RepID=UPI001FB3ECB8|nr:DUF2207 domain-containing protein [Rathayibacter caricis]MCJ1697403.1 DUF2207 domain-containing protein [Rathayibacter caricis]
MRATLSAVLSAATAGGLLLAALLAAPAAAADALRAGVDDFRFSEYSADFVLDRDAEGRSILTTQETFVAEFPPNQNRGMQRAIPLEFEGRPTDVDLVSVTDGDGAPRPVDTESEDGFLIVTSAADDYVSGSQTYVFTYTQRNVTLPASGTSSGEDEFYWDANGTAWRQPFDDYRIRVELGPGLAEAATGTASCYRGVAGSTDGCVLDEADGVVTASGTDLAAGENVTIAVGFAPGTFTPRDDSYFAAAWGWVQLIGLAASLVLLAVAARRRATVLKDAPGRPTIIAEYEPPVQGLFLSAQLRTKTTKVAAAALVDSAVRRFARIEEVEGRKGKPSFLLRVLDPAEVSLRRAGRPRPLAVDEQRFRDIAFGPSPAPGTVRDLAEKDKAFGKEVTALLSTLTKRAEEEGLRRPGTVRGSVWLILATVVAVIVAVVGGAGLLAASLGGALPFVLVLVAIAIGALVCVLLAKVPVTAAGAELRDHLRGLELYLKLAEADRFAVLQSPEGAQRRMLGPVEVVEVTERLLPWAVLLGLESEWATALLVAYEQAGEDPVWYSGSSGFQAAAFASSVSSFSSSASSFVGSSTSSSSGGAGGGGSSGGGGGGGGGGGV